MPIQKILLCLLVLLSKPLQAMNANDIQKEVIKLSQSKYWEIQASEFKELESAREKKGIYITLTTEKDSLWDNKANIDSHIERLKKSLSLCGLHLKGYLKVIIKTNNGFNSILKSRSTKTPVVETQLFHKNQQFYYPTFFLLNERRQLSTAKAFTEDFIERMARINQNVSNLKDTLWITDDFQSYKDSPNALPSYSVIAHELVHVLGVSGHVHTKEPNLMNSSDLKDTKNYQLTNSQCKKIIKKLEL